MPGFNSFRVTPSGAEFDYVAPQPPPKNDPEAKPIWPLIIRESDETAEACDRAGTETSLRRAKYTRLLVVDMKQRHEFGVAKYGVPLVAKNDRDHLVDALQEALDAVAYLRAELEKRGGFPLSPCKNAALVMLARIYARQCELAIDLRGLIYERDGR